MGHRTAWQQETRRSTGKRAAFGKRANVAHQLRLRVGFADLIGGVFGIGHAFVVKHGVQFA